MSDEDKGTRWELFELLERIGSLAEEIHRCCSSVRHGSRFDEDYKYQQRLGPELREQVLEHLRNVEATLGDLETLVTVLAWGDLKELEAKRSAPPTVEEPPQ